jgi:hypothetical protein
MSIITKQMILKKLFLTPEMIEIIKSYAFYDLIEKTKKIKNEIITLINNSFHMPLNFRPISYTKSYIFWIDDRDKNSLQLQCEFCMKCGNYVYPYYSNIKITCGCSPRRLLI